MNTTTISSVFFAFWWIIGDYFIALISLGLVFIIIYSIYYFIFKR
jgi:hypothetical protein